MTALFISAAHKSSGKTTVSMGLCAALRQRGLQVQPFKKGPDYIDPMWLGAAAGRDCHNLDFNNMGMKELRAHYSRYQQGADISIIEGNKGLYDGLDIEGRNSNAALARLLKVPVILVIDTNGMTRGIAPLILGYQAFDKRVRIAGVILNKVGGRRHEGKLRAVLEYYTDVPVVGAVYADPELVIDERHLGLIPSNEAQAAALKIHAIGKRVGEQVDLDTLLQVAGTAPIIAAPKLRSTADKQKFQVRIGIARDSAFGFYYASDLDALRQAGAELVFFDTLRDAHLPAVDGLFIGGGFPETHAAALTANRSLRDELKNAIELGMPVYAECGGLMYLSRSLRWRDQTHAMVGAIPADTVMHARPQGRGYIRVRETGANPWGLGGGEKNASEICAHEFHYSSLENIAPDVSFAYEVLRGHGIDGTHDGIVYKNVLGSYAHMRDVTANPWAARFVAFVACHAGGKHSSVLRATG